MITSVELGNFLSHKKSEINFDNGVTVFIGENGSGKSSVIDGITFSLFGKTTRGNEEDLLRDGENQAYTKTNFAINGQNFTAIKKIQKKGPSEHKLLGHSGEPVAIRSGEVKDEIQRLIELDYDTLQIASIVPQGQLTDITDPSKTAKLRNLIEKIKFVVKNDFIRVSYSDAFDILKNSNKNKKKKFEFFQNEEILLCK